jgi:hypothetical protein
MRMLDRLTHDTRLLRLTTCAPLVISWKAISTVLCGQRRRHRQRPGRQLQGRQIEQSHHFRPV